MNMAWRRTTSLLMTVIMLWTAFPLSLEAKAVKAKSHPLPLAPVRPPQLKKDPKKASHPLGKGATAPKVALIPPPARPPSVRRGPKKVKLIESKFLLSSDPSDFELSNARVFREPLVPMHSSKVVGENGAIAKALLAYKSKTDPDDVSDLTGFLAAFPKSRWRPSLEYNLGLRRFETGYLTDA